MSSETSIVAAQYRLQGWAVQIRVCQGRLAGMGVIAWYACHDITKVDYYYCFRCVRQVCLENLSDESPLQ